MDGPDPVREEYNQIVQRRSLFSGLIMDWLKVMIPVGGGLFGFLSWLGYWLGQETSTSYFWLLPLLGWLFFATPMFAWRIVAHHISRQITVMYPRMLELERRLGWSVDTVYFYNNLSEDGRQIVLRCLPDLREHDRPERRDYPRYEQLCRQMRLNPHDLLLRVWQNLGYQSVGSRGHAPQDMAVYVVSIVALAIGSILAWNLGVCPWALAIISGVFFAIVTLVFSLIVWPRRALN